MLFVFLAWALVLLTFTIWLRALHAMPIYTYTPLAHDRQQLDLRTLYRLTQMLLSLSLIFIVLHFTLPKDTNDTQLQHTGPTQNASTNASGPSGEPPVITTLANGTAAPPEKLR
jgi:hypothetical protein